MKPDFIESEADEASMKNEIRILCVEDVPADVVMLNHALRLGGLRFRSKRVDTKAAFMHELEHHPPDVILSDHGLPSFDGFTALAIAKSRCPEVPFIFVTSGLGEEMTISTFENGATDYVLKKDLSKLAPAVERALREAEERAVLKQKAEQLRESEQRYRRLIEFCPDAFFVQCDGQIVFANLSAGRLLGVENVEQITGRPVKEIVHPDSWPELDKRFNQLLENGTTFFWRKIEKGNIQSLNQAGATFPFFEEKFVRQDGSLVEVEVAATPLTYQNRQAIQIIVRNITERKRTEEALQKSEERYRRLVERSPEAILVIHANDEIAFANPAATKLLGVENEADLTGQSAEKFFRPDPWDVIVSRVRRLRSGQPFTPFLEQQLLRVDGVPVDVELSSAPTVYLGKPAVQVIAHDISERKKNLEKLHRSEDMKALILETALDAIISVDHEGKIQEWNPAAQKIFGYKRAEAVGQLMDQLIIPPAMWEVYHDGLTHYLMTGVGSLIGRPIELTLKRKDGSEFRAEIGISRILTEDPPRCTALIRDITERKQAETFLRQSEERLRLLVENVKDYAIYMLDPEGKIVTWNTGAEQVEGYRAEEIIGKHLSTFFTPEDVRRNVPQEALKRAENEGRALNEGWRVRKDGSCFWSQGIITALHDEDGKLRGFSKIAHDVTKQKKAEEKIHQLNEQLEQRVRARTAQLEAANNELEAFSYSISHDLRAPLRHIAGYVEILQSEAADKLDAQAREHLQTVADSAKNLGELIDALLAFSRMGRAEMRQERVRLSILVEEARRELRRDCDGRDIDWQIAKLPEVRGDPIMLRQVIINLLSNALKYTRKCKRARIEIGATDSESEVTFFIRDNGIGFDM
ncbi:MAG TPA: PAS domain S-box protein, partial [Candidatus Acidoferrales bacterium]|nr:PAS domain S-box protein [Candidatus Acidoferrales bacterium]